MPVTKKPSKSAEKKRKPRSSAILQARLDQESKDLIAEAAQLRSLGITDYVRAVLVPAARREVDEAKKNILTLTADEQKACWDALQSPPRVTASQKRLGQLIRGEA